MIWIGIFLGVSLIAILIILVRRILGKENGRRDSSNLLNRRAMLINECLKDPSAYIFKTSKDSILIHSRTPHTFAEFSIKENMNDSNRTLIKWRSDGKTYGNKYKTWVFGLQVSDDLIIEQIKKDMQVILDEMLLKK